MRRDRELVPVTMPPHATSDPRSHVRLVPAPPYDQDRDELRAPGRIAR